MAAVAHKREKSRTFHATVRVTRTEQWWVDARTAEEARQLLLNGEGYRCDAGDCLHIEIDKLEG
jgi:hypothetical protein